MGAAVYILVGLDQGLGRITEIGPGGKIGMRGKVQAVQDAPPDVRVDVHHGRGPKKPPLVNVGEKLAPRHLVSHVVVVVPRMIERPAGPAGSIAVPIVQPFPVVLGNPGILLGQKAGIRSGPVVGPALVQRRSLERPYKPRHRVVEECMRIFMPQDIGVFGIVYAARAELKGAVVRKIDRIIAIETLRIDPHREIEQCIADIE